MIDAMITALIARSLVPANVSFTVKREHPARMVVTKADGQTIVATLPAGSNTMTVTMVPAMACWIIDVTKYGRMECPVPAVIAS